MARLLGTIVGYIHTGASTRTVVGFGLAQMFARGAPLNHAVQVGAMMYRAAYDLMNT